MSKPKFPIKFKAQNLKFCHLDLRFDWKFDIWTLDFILIIYLELGKKSNKIKSFPVY